jgi:hypothetical protein
MMDIELFGVWWFGTVAVLCFVGATGLWAWSLWREHNLIEGLYELQDEWFMGRVVVSDFSDDLLMDALNPSHWREGIPLEVAYFEALLREAALRQERWGLTERGRLGCSNPELASNTKTTGSTDEH